MTESDDPTVIRTVVVTASDLVAALEANHETANGDAVLRITPPFSASMRARLHVQRECAVGEPAPVCLRPQSLVDDACPEPPEPDDVEDRLRADSAVSYTIARHQERYRTALQQWRASVPDHVVEGVVLPATDRTVTVSILGTVSGA